MDNEVIVKREGFIVIPSPSNLMNLKYNQLQVYDQDRDPLGGGYVQSWEVTHKFELFQVFSAVIYLTIECTGLKITIPIHGIVEFQDPITVSCNPRLFGLTPLIKFSTMKYKP